MKRFIVLLLVAVCGPAAAAPPQRVAVVPFQALGGSEDAVRAARALGPMLTAHLERYPEVSVVPREQTEPLAGELRLDESGPSAVPPFQADVLVGGSVSGSGELRVRLVAWSVGERRALLDQTLRGTLPGLHDIAASAVTAAKRALGLGLPSAIPSPVAGRRISVVVLPFEDLLQPQPLGSATDPLGKTVAHALGAMPAITVVSADEAPPARQESLGDYVPDSVAAQTARRVGAGYAVVGSYTGPWARWLVVRAIEAATGRVAATELGATAAPDRLALAAGAAVGLARRLGIEVSDEVARQAAAVAPGLAAGALEHVVLGREHLGAGRYPQAEAEFRAALAESPDSALALYYLADSLRKQDKHAEAVKAAEEGLKHVEGAPEPWLPSRLHGVAAMSLLELDQWQRARDHFRAYSETTPNPTSRYGGYIELGKWLAGHEKGPELLEWTKEFASKRFVATQNAVAAFSQMVQWSEDYAGLTPDTVELERRQIAWVSAAPKASTRDYIERPIRRLSELYAENGAFEDGARFLREIAQTYGGRDAAGFAWFHLGDLLERAGKHVEAVEAYVHAADAAPGLWLGASRTMYSTPLAPDSLARAATFALDELDDQARGVQLLQRLYAQHGAVGGAGRAAAERLGELGEPLAPPGKWALLAGSGTMTLLPDVLRAAGYTVHQHRFGAENPAPTQWSGYALIAGTQSPDPAHLEPLLRRVRSGAGLLLILAGWTGRYAAYPILPALGLTPRIQSRQAWEVQWARDLSDHPVVAGLDGVPASPYWGFLAPPGQSLARKDDLTYVAAGAYGLGRYVVVAVDWTALEAGAGDSQEYREAHERIEALLTNAVSWLSAPSGDARGQAILAQFEQAERAAYGALGEVPPQGMDKAASLLNGIIEQHPHTPFAHEARLRLAALHRQRGEWDQAIAQLKALIALSPPDEILAPGYLSLGDCYASQQPPDADSAIEAYRTIPGPPERYERMLGWLKIGALEQDRGRAPQAALALQQAAKWDQVTVLKVLAMRGLEQIYRDRGQTDRADALAAAIAGVKPSWLKQLQFPQDLLAEDGDPT